MGNIKYICEYALPNGNVENRSHALSANDKIDYIVSALNKSGEHVDIISPSLTNDFKIYHSRKDKLTSLNTLFSGPGFPIRFGFISQIISKMWLMFFLIKNCKSNDVVVAYHGKFKIPFILCAKMVCHFKLVLEVEEIYSDLNTQSNKKLQHWLEMLIIKYASAYIFASKQLNENYNTKNKPYVIANGSYIAKPNLVSNNDKNSEVINIVYAGLIKKDLVVFRCVDIAHYLSEKYAIHIIGYGDEKDITALIEKIREVNDNTACHVSFDGIKRGKEYDEFLQSCDIGICPLNASYSYQKACFPSKITSYLSNGLLVVTTENEVIRESAYGSIVVFSKTQSAEDFADIIKQIDITEKRDARDLIRILDLEFISNIRILIDRMRRE